MKAATKKIKTQYTDVRRLLKSHPAAKYYVVYGERSNGKTYSSLAHVLDRYYGDGSQFAYIRRWGEDIRPKNLLNLFQGLERDGYIRKLSGEYDLIEYRQNRFWPYRQVEDAKGGIDKVVAEEPLGYAYDLNSSEHIKSNDFPKIKTIIFDEFMARKGYLPNEFILFMNLLSTLIRDKDDVTIIMLGNPVNRYCPYFTEMGLEHIKDMKPGDVQEYTYGESGLSVVVEYTGSKKRASRKASDVYFAFDNPELKMITTGDWEIAPYPRLPRKYRPKDVAFTFFVDFDKDVLHCDIVVDEEGEFIFVHPKTTPIRDGEVVFCTVPDGRHDHIVGLFSSRSRISSVIKVLINNNAIFYSDNVCGEVMRNYIIWSTNYSSVLAEH